MKRIFVLFAVAAIGCGVNASTDLDEPDPIILRQPGPGQVQVDSGKVQDDTALTDSGVLPDEGPPVVDTLPGVDTNPVSCDTSPPTCGGEICKPSEVCKDGKCVCNGEHSDDKTCKQGKVLLCHYPPGNPDNRHEICVGSAAVPAHMKHGDTLGECK